MSIYTYRKRLFLASVTTGFTSYVFAEVESSCNGEYDGGNYMLTIADCRRATRLEFFLGNATARRQSLAKIDLLLRVLNEFRVALVKEAQLIASFEKKQFQRRPKLKQVKE
ncbi:MAG: hypothetical protein ABR555_10375 [Pyrinomonadaceae bacterium]